MNDSNILKLGLIQLFAIFLFAFVYISSPKLHAQDVEEIEVAQEQTEAEDVKESEAEKLKKEIYGDELNTGVVKEEEDKGVVVEEEESKPQPVIVNGDVVEYIAETNDVVAEGNVEIFYGDTTLTCDRIKVNTQTKAALAEGNVVLSSENGIIRGDEVTMNFDSKKGKIVAMRFEADPYYGAGVSADRLSETEIVIKQSFFTTCDFNKPHYRMQTRKMKIYWGDKIVAKNVLIMVGNCPVFYIPSFVHKFNETRPRVRLAFGKTKDWGIFTLSAWRYEFNQLIQGRLNLDLREKRGFAWGVTNPYTISGFGKGVFKSYYTNERKVQTSHWWYDQEKYLGLKKPIYKERYMFNLRHKWDPNEKTEVILELFKTRDKDFIKDYFEERYDKEMQEKSYLQILSNLSEYSYLSFYVRKRLNRIYDVTEELPSIGYVISSLPLFQRSLDNDDSNENGFSNFRPFRFGSLYLTSQNYFKNLNQKYTAPSDEDDSAITFDLYNKLSLSSKIAFVELNPYVAARETFFSEDTSDNKWPAPRTVFYSGVDLTTKFYRIFNVHSKILDINYLRHIIQPTASFNYVHEPTVSSSHIKSVVGDISASNSVSLELLNKLQTKRGGGTGEDLRSEDILRYSVNTTYSFKSKSQGGGRFSDFSFDLELLPRDWIKFEAVATYNHRENYFNNANFDIILDFGQRARFSSGYRYDHEAGRELTCDFELKINPKWSISTYQRFNFQKRSWQEQQYILSRDLHCWVLEIMYDVRREEGETIYFVLRSKAFPDMSLEFDRSYHNPKMNSQGYHSD